MRLRVIFRATGGPAGLDRGCELDTAAMRIDETRELERLVQQSDPFGFHLRAHVESLDFIHYALRVEENGRSIAISVNEAQVWAELRPLISFLEKRSTDAP